MKLRKLKFGFSLVELSMSLVIIGVILLVVMSSLKSIGDNTAAIKTEARLAKAADIANYLSYGREMLATNDLYKQSTTEQDAYGNDINYYPAPGITNGPIDPNATFICDAENTNYSLVIKEDGANDKTVKNVAFVVTSNGVNLQNEVNSETNKLTINISKDDTYRYVSLYELKAIIGCEPPNRLKIITMALPPIVGNRDVNRNIIFTSFGTKKNAQFCIQAKNLAQLNTVDQNLRFRLITTMNDINNGALLAPTFQTCQEGDFSRSVQAIRVEPTPGATIGTYVFTVSVRKPGTNNTILDKRQFVQSIVKTQ